jgi:hypothetical protein
LLITSTFDERTLDMMFGDELNDDFHDVRRHWHSLDKIAAGIGECLCFGWISRYGQNLTRLFRCDGAQDYPLMQAS